MRRDFFGFRAEIVIARVLDGLLVFFSIFFRGLPLLLQALDVIFQEVGEVDAVRRVRSGVERFAL
jgi:hypothetical protein